MQYIVHRTSRVPLFRDSDFAAAEVAELTNVCPKSSEHHPKITLQLLHDDRNIYGLYSVKDQYVRAVATTYQDSVCQDSCVEFFFKPSVGPGYFNLEMSAGGTYLFYYVADCTRTEHGFKEYYKVSPEYGNLITVKTSLPHIIEPEITEPVDWQVMFTIPAEAIEPYCGELGSLNKQEWTANFYKCADKTSHPHWITWAPLTILNYHQPDRFQSLILE